MRVRGKGECNILNIIQALSARKKGRGKLSWQLIMSDGVTQVFCKASLSLDFLIYRVGFKISMIKVCEE